MFLSGAEVSFFHKHVRAFDKNEAQPCKCICKLKKLQNLFSLFVSVNNRRNVLVVSSGQHLSGFKKNSCKPDKFRQILISLKIFFIIRPTVFDKCETILNYLISFCSYYNKPLLLVILVLQRDQVIQVVLLQATVIIVVLWRSQDKQVHLQEGKSKIGSASEGRQIIACTGIKVLNVKKRKQKRCTCTDQENKASPN